MQVSKRVTKTRRDKARLRLELEHTLVDVRRVGLLAGLGALLLVARGGSLLAGILLLLRSLGGSSGSLGGGLLVSSLGSHFERWKRGLKKSVWVGRVG